MTDTIPYYTCIKCFNQTTKDAAFSTRANTCICLDCSIAERKQIDDNIEQEST